MFYRLCDEQLSNQSHYDFGLRALKSVLISAGNVKRDRIQRIKEGMKQRGDSNIDEASIAENLPEQEILIQSVCETMVPKLVAEDIPLLFSLLNDVFPNVQYTRAEMKGKIFVFLELQVDEFFSQDSRMKSARFAKKNSLYVAKETNKVQLGWKR